MSPNEHTSDSGQFRQQLYEVMQSSTLSLPEKQERALELGAAYLDIDNGFVLEIGVGEGVDEVVASVGEEGLGPPGTRVAHATTYCRRTVESHSPIALSAASEEGWEDDPGYQEHEYDCYLGTSVFVRGEIYGTVCFVAPDARRTAFTSEEEVMVELIARLVGRALEAHEYDRNQNAQTQALEASETKYRSLLQTAPDAILLIDAGSGEITEANDAAARLTGYDRSALLGLAVQELHAPSDAERYAAEIQRFIDSEETRNRFADGLPLYIRHRNGDHVPVEISASAVEFGDREQLLAIVRDITDRREREHELRVKNRVVAEASVGITIADAADPDLPIIYANRDFERLTGYDRTEVLGKNCRFLQGPKTEDAAVETIREALQARESMTTEILNYRTNGTPFWNELTLTPVTGENGDEVTHFVGFQRDITAKKRRERLISVLNRVLRHNLRNDMNVVGGYAEMIADEGGDDLAEMAGHIVDTAADLTALSEKARALEEAVRDPADIEARNVVADAASAIDSLEAAHPETDFSLDAPDEAFAVATESLRMALYELGENAVKHGSPSRVEVHIDPTDAGQIAIHVSDSGPGLSTYEQRVFETGQETPLNHGQGLGLWLVNWVVTAVGGDMTATVDDGTTITVRLPAVSKDADTERLKYYRRAAISTDTE